MSAALESMGFGHLSPSDWLDLLPTADAAGAFLQSLSDKEDILSTLLNCSGDKKAVLRALLTSNHCLEDKLRIATSELAAASKAAEEHKSALAVAHASVVGLHDALLREQTARAKEQEEHHAKEAALSCQLDALWRIAAGEINSLQAEVDFYQIQSGPLVARIQDLTRRWDDAEVGASELSSLVEELTVTKFTLEAKVYDLSHAYANLNRVSSNPGGRFLELWEKGRAAPRSEGGKVAVLIDAISALARRLGVDIEGARARKGLRDLVGDDSDEEAILTMSQAFDLRAVCDDVSISESALRRILRVLKPAGHTEVTCGLLTDLRVSMNQVLSAEFNLHEDADITWVEVAPLLRRLIKATGAGDAANEIIHVYLHGDGRWVGRGGTHFHPPLN